MDKIGPSYIIHRMADNIYCKIKDKKIKKIENNPIFNNHTAITEKERLIRRIANKKDFFEGLPLSEKFVKLIKKTTKHSNVLRTLLIRCAIHPATWLRTGSWLREQQKALEGKPEAELSEGERYLKNKFMGLERAVKNNAATPVVIFPKEGLGLEGYIVKPSSTVPPGRKEEERPMMVMVLPNMGCCQLLYSLARVYADANDMDVLIYNSRGVGNSMGKSYNTEDTVADCKAALNFAVKQKGDSKKIAVYGQSLGGGVSAEAMRQLKEEPDTKDITFGLYINHHSFSSLSDFLEGFFGGTNERRMKGFTTISEKALSLLSINALNTSKTLTSQEPGKFLADKTIVVTTKNDEIIKGRAQLSSQIFSPGEVHIVSETQEHGFENEIEVIKLKKMFQQQFVQKLFALLALPAPKTADSNALNVLKEMYEIFLAEAKKNPENKIRLPFSLELIEQLVELVQKYPGAFEKEIVEQSKQVNSASIGECTSVDIDQFSRYAAAVAEWAKLNS